MEPRRRVVVTGMGIVSAAGCDVEAVWQRLLAGCSSVRRIGRFDTRAYPSQIAAEIDHEPTERSPLWRDRGRIACYASRAASDAVAASALTGSRIDRSRVGVVAAAGMGSYDHHEVFAACAAAARHGRDDADWGCLADTLRRELRPQAAPRRTPGSIPATIAVEMVMFGAGLWLYLGAAPPRTRGQRIGLWALVVFLQIVYVANVFGPPPPSANAVAWSGVAMWLLILWAWAIDRSRSEDGKRSAG